MTKTPLEKMFYKPSYSAAILHLPQDLEKELNANIDHTLSKKYDFILTFYTKKDDLEKEAAEVKESLVENGLLWIAYPKNKALQTDLNRDILHEMLSAQNLDGVSIVSLNETWSSMRFKKI
jgi:hypothetical protein